METCKTCRFWERRTAGDWAEATRYGKCRRKSPIDRGNNNAWWPETHETDWCGEHKPAEAPTDAR